MVRLLLLVCLYTSGGQIFSAYRRTSYVRERRGEREIVTLPIRENGTFLSLVFSRRAGCGAAVYSGGGNGGAVEERELPRTE